MISNNIFLEGKIKIVQERCQELTKKQIIHDSELMELKNKTIYIQTLFEKSFSSNQNQNFEKRGNSNSSFALTEKKYSNQNNSSNLSDSYENIISIIKKMEVNTFKNFQKVESYINQNSQQLNNKLEKVQSKIINLLFQKEVILQQFSRNIQKSDFSIQAIQNYLKSQRQRQTNSIDLFYDNLCEKIKVSQKNWDLKQLNILKQIQNLKLETQSFRSDIFTNFQKIQASLSNMQQNNEQNIKKYASNFNFSSGSVDQKQGSNQNYENLLKQVEIIKKQNKDTKRLLTKLQNIVKQANSSIKQIQYKIQNLNLPTETRLSSKQSQTVNKFVNKNDFKSKRQKQIQIQTYQRHDYNSIMGDQPKQEEVRGIRGLLKKSKQKEEPKLQQANSKKLHKFQQQRQVSPFQSMKQKSASKLLKQKQKLSPVQRKPNNLKRQLPPVKEQTHSKKKFNQQKYDVIQLSSQNGQEQEYEVDQNGFLLDKYGQYVYGEDGNIMQLSQEYLQQLLNQQN